MPMNRTHAAFAKPSPRSPLRRDVRRNQSLPTRGGRSLSPAYLDFIDAKKTAEREEQRRQRFLTAALNHLAARGSA